MKKMVYILMLSLGMGLSAFVSGACCCYDTHVQNGVTQISKGSITTYRYIDRNIIVQVQGT